MPRPQNMQIAGFYDQDPRSNPPLDAAIVLAYTPTDSTLPPLEGATAGSGGFWEIWRSFDPSDVGQSFPAPWDPDLVADGWDIYLHRLSQDVERVPQGLYTVRFFGAQNGSGWVSTPLQPSGPLDDAQKQRLKELMEIAQAEEYGTDRRDYSGWEDRVFEGDEDAPW